MGIFGKLKESLSKTKESINAKIESVVKIFKAVDDELFDELEEILIMSDIGYIKACMDRVEKNLTRVDEICKNVIERLAKVEESVAHITRRVDEPQGN